MNENELYWVGMDVSMANFDAALVAPGQHPSGESLRQLPARTFRRDVRGVKEFVHWVRDLVPGAKPLPVRGVMEATGIYSIQLAAMLSKAFPECSAAIANPQQTSSFRDSLGLRNKTDRLDARALAFFGLINKPAAYVPLSHAQAELRSLTRCREALVKERTAHQHQLKQAPVSPVSRDVFRDLIKQLNKKVCLLEKAMRGVIRSDVELQRDYTLLTTIPGVGLVTAATVLGEFGDLRRFGGSRQIGAHAGVTASHNDSGNSTPPAHMSKQGNSHVRRALYMASLSAITYNPHLCMVNQRLKAIGKKRKVALGAVMRKLIVLMRAIIVSGHPYEPQWKTQWKTTLKKDAEPTKAA